MNVLIYRSANQEDIKEVLLPLGRGEALDAFTAACQPGVAPAGSVIACFFESGRLSRVQPVEAMQPEPEPVVEEPVEVKKKK